MDWDIEIKDSEFVPQNRKPTEETVCYKIGGTYYEVSTSCGGSERLRDKMIRLIKSETVKTPNDKQGQAMYNKYSTTVCRAFITGGMNT